MVHVGPRLRSARAIQAAAAFRHPVRVATVLRRSGGDRRGAGAASRRHPRRQPAGARHRDRRSRRGARRPRRGIARTLRVRVDAAHPADHRGACFHILESRYACRRALARRRAARRSSADDARGCRPDGARGFARTLAAVSRRASIECAAHVVLRGDGWHAESGLGAAVGRDCRTWQVHRSADRRTLRSRGRSGREAKSVRPVSRSRSHAGGGAARVPCAASGPAARRNA